MTDEHLIGARTITREEIREASLGRVSIIVKEFADGFNFIKDYPKSVTFFGGTRFTEDSPYYKLARSLGSRIVKEIGYSVFSGGGPGIMEAANRGAFEAGGESLGLTIQLPNNQPSNKYLTDQEDFYYFFIRKVCLSFSAETYIFFPGGFGTLDEFFEVLTLVQTHKIEKVPIILAGSDYWNKLDSFIKAELLTRQVINPGDVNLYTITDDEDEILEIIKSSPVNIEM